MIEITFTESAGGGLKMAHALLHNQQSSSQTTLPTEIPPSFQAYVGENVFCFSLMLTVGKISEELFFSQRQDILQQLYHDLPKDLPSGTQMAKDCIEQTKQQMTMLKKRLQEKKQSVSGTAKHRMIFVDFIGFVIYYSNGSFQILYIF